VSAEREAETPGSAARRAAQECGAIPLDPPGYVQSQMEERRWEAIAQAAIDSAPSLIVKVTSKLSEEDVRELRTALERAMAARAPWTGVLT